MNIQEELTNNQILLSVFSKDYYNESVFESMKNLKDKKICYVSLNKTSDSLEKAFTMHGISNKNLFFIDAVSKGIGKAQEKENILLVSSPAALTELSIAITQAIESGFFDVLLFDSLSTLNIYNLGESTQKFTSHIINKVKGADRKGVFTCLEDDVNTNLIKNSSMYVDRTVRFSDLYQSIEHRKHNMTFAALIAVAALGVFSFLKFPGMGTQVTGLVVSEASTSSSNVFFIMFMIIAVVAVSLFISKIVVPKPISNETLVKIQPEQHDEATLEKQIKSKMQGWFSKVK